MAFDLIRNRLRCIGTIVALYVLLGAFGALTCTFVGDRLGRRKTIFAANVVQMIGAALQASAFQLGQFIVGRILLGLGTGGILATISLWQTEMSRPESRGKHVSAIGAFITFGLSVGFWIAFGMSYTQPSSASWRFVLAFPIFNSLLACATIFHLPESPRWLCKVGCWEEAREMFSVLHDEDPHSLSINQEIRGIAISLNVSGKSKITSILEMGDQRAFNRVLLALAAQMLLQMSGVNA